jgi:hypothetical protein
LKRKNKRFQIELKKLDRNLPNGEVGSPAVERRKFKIIWRLFGDILRLFGDNLGEITEENIIITFKILKA